MSPALAQFPGAILSRVPTPRLQPMSSSALDPRLLQTSLPWQRNLPSLSQGSSSVAMARAVRAGEGHGHGCSSSWCLTSAL